MSDDGQCCSVHKTLVTAQHTVASRLASVVLNVSVLKANRRNVLLASARDTSQTISALLRAGQRAVIIDKVTPR